VPVDPDPGEGAQLVGGWGALLDGWEEELEYRQELAWEAEERARRASEWLRLLTAVSRLPAPDRDALRGYLTMGLPVEVLAALLRLSEADFCEVLARAAKQLRVALTKAMPSASVTAILTPPPHQAGKRAPRATQARQEVA
jgi:DNA-directed RNA polymerase specialized sigma24 family protein